MNQASVRDIETHKLRDFLLDGFGLDDEIDIAMLDGYLTVIVSGPGTILPSQWLPRA